MTRFLTGLAILFVAQVLSAFMGLYIENTYATFGNNYREGLFYTVCPPHPPPLTIPSTYTRPQHALSLPLFLIFSSSIKTQFSRLLASPPLPAHPLLASSINNLLPLIPRQLLFLILNSLTQCVCIRGVNILSSISSALTVTIVLNIRKLVSLLLSIWLFTNKLSPGVMVGAAVVFAGGFLYGFESQQLGAKRRRLAAAAREKSQ